MKTSLFVISEKKKKNELIASELNSFEKVRMRIYARGNVFSREVLYLVKLSGGFKYEVWKILKIISDVSREVLKFVKFSSQTTRCFGHGRRIMFLLRSVFEGGFQKACKLH